tara:strand:- start:5844 stop:6455 length:612 start_codon:yes stop_codon:yes gene_type:complete
MNTELKKLVKKHFNLVDAPITETFVEETIVDVVEEIAMAEIKTADGSITLTYEGEELTIGSMISVVTEDGNIPAPDGYHDLEGGITIKVEGGVVSEIADTVIEEAEAEIEDNAEVIIESAFEMHEELIKALSAEFKTQIDALKLDFTKQLNEVKGNVEKFSSAPSTEKTIATKNNSKKTDVSYEPTDSKKKAQFERLVALRNK